MISQWLFQFTEVSMLAFFAFLILTSFVVMFAGMTSAIFPQLSGIIHWCGGMFIGWLIGIEFFKRFKLE
jgi:hypothetical protein